MKASIGKLFSFSVIDSEYCDFKQEKFEVVSCPNKERTCNKQLSAVNEFYFESEHYIREKNFQASLESLRSAFYKTMEITGQPCVKCASLFRSTIIDSLTDIHRDLNKMSKGFFGNKHYEPSFLMAEKILSEVKRVEVTNKVKVEENKKVFLGNSLKKNVS